MITYYASFSLFFYKQFQHPIIYIIYIINFLKYNNNFDVAMLISLTAF